VGCESNIIFFWKTGYHIVRNEGRGVRNEK
jgi:hypothetical protein